MNGVRAALPRGVQDRGNRKVAFSRRRRADAHGAVREQHVRCARIGVRVDCNGWDPELAAGADDANGNLAAVRDQDLRDASHEAFRFSRKARSPSCPSSETLLAAMASAVSPAASVPRAQTRGISALAVEIASGAPLRNSFTYITTIVST